MGEKKLSILVRCPYFRQASTVGPPNNENIGTAIVFHYSEVFFIERYVYIMVKPVFTWE